MKYKQKNNILHICNNFDAFYLDYFSNLIKIDTSNTHSVYYFREKERGIPDINLPEYVKISLSYSKFDKYFFRFRAKKIIKDIKKNYDLSKITITHAHTMYTNGYISYLLYKEYNIPYIIAIRATDIHGYMRIRKDLKYLGDKILENAEKIVFISESNKKEFLKQTKTSNKTIINKTVVIPNGVSKFYLDNLYFRDHRDLQELENNINLITVGHIYKRKNQLETAKVLNNIYLNGFELKYTVVGKILDKRYFKELMTYEFVKYIPFLTKEELLKEYRSNSIYVMLSKPETFGITYVEAMTQGLPVIYLKGNGIDGMFKNNNNGYGLESIDEIEIAIKNIIDNYNYISEYNTTVSKKFSWERIQQDYVDIYRKILDEYCR